VSRRPGVRVAGIAEPPDENKRMNELLLQATGRLTVEEPEAEHDA